MFNNGGAVILHGIADAKSKHIFDMNKNTRNRKRPNLKPVPIRMKHFFGNFNKPARVAAEQFNQASKVSFHFQFLKSNCSLDLKWKIFKFGFEKFSQLFNHNLNPIQYPGLPEVNKRRIIVIIKEHPSGITERDFQSEYLEKFEEPIKLV